MTDTRRSSARWNCARRPPEAEGRLYQQLEVEHGPFRRTVSLGAEVDADQAKAVYEEGMLVITLPLKEPPGARSVPIQSKRQA